MRLWHNALRLHAAAMRSSCSSVILWPWVSFSQGMSDESRKFGAFRSQGRDMAQAAAALDPNRE